MVISFFISLSKYSFCFKFCDSILFVLKLSTEPSYSCGERWHGSHDICDPNPSNFGFYLLFDCSSNIEITKTNFDLLQFLKISFVIFIAWTLLVLTILFEDQVNPIDFSTLKIGIMMYFMMLPILALSCMGANSCYFLMDKVNQKKNMILF